MSIRWDILQSFKSMFIKILITWENKFNISSRFLKKGNQNSDNL